MTSHMRRLELLEKQFLPQVPTESDRRMMESIIAGRQRVVEYYALHGLTLPEPTPPHPEDYHLTGMPRVMTMLNRGREHVALARQARIEAARALAEPITGDSAK